MMLNRRGGYTKSASKDEFENHRYFHEKGIKTPKIIDWDPDIGQLTMEHIDGYVISDLPRLNYDPIAISIKLIDQVKRLHELG